MSTRQGRTEADVIRFCSEKLSSDPAYAVSDRYPLPHLRVVVLPEAMIGRRVLQQTEIRPPREELETVSEKYFIVPNYEFVPEWVTDEESLVIPRLIARLQDEVDEFVGDVQ